MDVLRVKPEGAARAEVVEVIPDTPLDSVQRERISPRILVV